MDTIKIDKGVEIPEQKRASKYPFAQLEIGDSFFIDRASRGRVSNSMTYWSKRFGRRFISRTVEGGLRVWRVE